MKAVEFKDQKISVVDVPVPEIAGDEALVKVMMAGICATDMELLHGYQGFEGIPGHEFVGFVEKAPGAPDLVGARVTADINVGCGDCPRCRSTDTRHCPFRKAIGIQGKNGAFAEYCAVPLANLRFLPDNLETIDAVFAEPLAAALEIAQQVHVHQQTRIAVLGDGRMGQLCALALDLYSRRVTMLGRHREKMALAAARGIATADIDETAGGGAAAHWKGAFDLVVDATGNPEALHQALALTRPEGLVVLKTTSRQPSPLNLAALVVDELTLLGSRCGDVGFAVKCLADQRIKPNFLVDRIYPFSEFPAAFAHAAQQGSMKVLLAFED
ncbi:MAG TPA: alcohol dehydrogenase catalytic domain-containing protein [Desulfosalsimonadaceae bacterium]|nr:alcohol dehydrogenase catalytic domain-containing protein [Desulfosalsimonadaceae bacterium]